MKLSSVCNRHPIIASIGVSMLVLVLGLLPFTRGFHSGWIPIQDVGPPLLTIALSLYYYKIGLGATPLVLTSTWIGFLACALLGTGCSFLLAVSYAIVALHAFAMLRIGRDPLLDMKWVEVARFPRISPILASAGASLLLVSFINLNIINYIIILIILSIITSLYSSFFIKNKIKSIVLGIISSNPITAPAAIAYASMHPLTIRSCEGTRLGDLLFLITGRTHVRRAEGHIEGTLCTEGDAVIPPISSGIIIGNINLNNIIDNFIIIKINKDGVSDFDSLRESLSLATSAGTPLNISYKLNIFDINKFILFVIDKYDGLVVIDLCSTENYNLIKFIVLNYILYKNVVIKFCVVNEDVVGLIPVGRVSIIVLGSYVNQVILNLFYKYDLNDLIEFFNEYGDSVLLYSPSCQGYLGVAARIA